MDVLRELVAAVEARQPVALATVVQTEGGAPAQPGFKLLVHADGSAGGNIGGGELEARVTQAALEAIAQGEPQTARYTLTDSGPDAMGMLCGGEVTVFVEPYLPKPILLVVGGGHIGRPLVELSRVLDYEVRVVDVEPQRATEAALDPAAVTPSTYVVIITENHESDEEALRQLVGTPAAYTGMIGSRRKVSAILDHLRAGGAPDAWLQRVHAPIGLDLGGKKPNEIALAILAEVEMVRHGGTHWPRAAAREAAIQPAPAGVG
jgi:xanthine dehydrogenase accessory factor